MTIIQTMNNSTEYTNNYLPYYPIHKNTLDDTLLRHKYERINRNKGEYFENAKIVNFDIIHNQCRKDPLKDSLKYYQTIKKNDLENILKEDEEQFIAAAIKCRRDDVNIARDVINDHFKVDFIQKNKILFSSMYGRKRKNEHDSAIALYAHLKINK